MSKGKKGFTLLEVLIALAIIMGGILLVGQSWSGNFLRVRKTDLYNNVALLLQRKAVEIEALYSTSSLADIPDSDAGDFGKDFPQYTWSMASQELEFPDLSAILIGQDGADEMLLTIMKQTQEFISKSVKEVTITVHVKTPIREIKYSVTTYFVDYNTNLSIGAGGG